jgi:D-lactate dehydrogenase
MALPAKPKHFSYGAARGFDLEGKTLGIIGVGPIGERVLKLSRAFGMRVLAWDPMGMPPERALNLGFAWVSLEELLRESHIVSLHVRLSARTHHLLNRETLALCRPGVFIVNTARGRLIDTEALHDALESGQVGGAGLDVLELEQVLREPASRIISAQIVEKLRSDTAATTEARGARLHDLKSIIHSDALLARHNVVFTPHVAFNSVEAMERLHAATVASLNAFMQGRPIHVVHPD